MFCPRQKQIISRAFKIRGTQVFMSLRERERERERENERERKQEGERGRARARTRARRERKRERKKERENKSAGDLFLNRPGKNENPHEPSKCSM
jgi:hypothetical protein